MSFRRHPWFCLWLAVAAGCAHRTGPPELVAVPEVVFEDHFDADSRAEELTNLVQRAPPQGLGYETAYPQGRRPTRWTLVDTHPGDSPLRGFWIVADEGEYLVQAGRSATSYLFANAPVPGDAVDYDVEFRQHRADNDPIAFILGARRLATDHGGIEVVHETQRPGTDETTPDLFVTGALGAKIVPAAAGMRVWKHHRLEVRGKHVRWFQDGAPLMAAAVPGLSRGGHFGLRHRYDRNTRYDDVRIVVWRRDAR